MRSHSPISGIVGIRPMLLATLWLFMQCSLAKDDVQVNTVNPQFAVGQEWSLRSARPSSIKIVIGLIEPWNDKVAIHVSVVGIPRLQAAGTSSFSTIAHLPIERSALAASVDKLLATHVLPAQSFDAGYNEWKEKRGGIYTIPVAQVLGLSQGKN
jgi:hypothetical protein